jgi:iron(III) transport system ATP-binding protein
MYDIELKKITKTYLEQKEPAVKSLSLCIEKGSITTLLGPSGCGKSTTLRLIAGFERADAGSIILAGNTVSDSNTWTPPEKRGVGMVFQDYALFPHLSVFNNIGFGYKGKDRTERVKEVIALVNLKGYEERYPNELSGGQQQRVALARALTRRPVVVLLDEPFSNLDADLRVHMRMEVRRIIKEAGATAVFVSHDQKDALAISDRVVVMKDGVIQQEGTPREIYQFPENIFVATFVGQTNILEGTIGLDGQSVMTPLGEIPCLHTHDLPPGTEVHLSVRAESLEMCKDGTVEGRVKSTVYTGSTIDAFVEVALPGGKTYDLLVHFHPEIEIKAGDLARFRVLPDFVAVIRH